MGKKKPAKYPLSECGEPRKAGFTPEHWWQVVRYASRCALRVRGCASALRPQRCESRV
jgi:hypothetical protein